MRFTVHQPNFHHRDSQAAELLLGLRQRGITDWAVLTAMELVPRDFFVDAEWRDEAFTDRALPIDCGQSISQPSVVAAMSQALKVEDRHKVLEVGTGSGYQTAILSRLARRVYTVERHRDLHLLADKRFQALGLHNVISRFADGWKGWLGHAPFDRILVTAAAPHVPPMLLDQLALGGIMVVPVGGEYETQNLLRLVKTTSGIEQEVLQPVRFVPLQDGVATSRRV